MTRPIRGLIPILATPFLPDGGLDIPSLERLLEFQLESGVDGVALFGMASEGYALTAADRQTILDCTERVIAGAVPIVAGVNSTSLVGALEQLEELSSRSDLTLMVLPPYMVPIAPAQLTEFFGTVGVAAAAKGFQVMVQDAPGATGVTMSPDYIAELAGLEGVTSAKVEAPPTAPKMEIVRDRLVAAGRDLEAFGIFGGQNSQFVLDEYANGAVGTMPACEFPDLLAPILADWNAGNHADAREAFAQLMPLIVQGLQSGYAWSIHKEVLVRRGIISHNTVRLPARPMSPGLHASMTSVLAGLPQIQAVS